MHRLHPAPLGANPKCRFRPRLQHRRRLIVMFVRHDVPAPSFPLPYTLFPGAGGYREGSEVCLLEVRGQPGGGGM